jgi:Cd2+/Zn2+-exporting ATPase
MSEIESTGASGYVQYRVRGMDCADEIAALRRAFAEVTDPESLRFDLLDGVMEVPESVSDTVVTARVAAAGMQAVRVDSETEEVTWWGRHGLDLLTAISGVAVVGAFLLHGVIESFAAAVGSEGMAVEEHRAPLYVLALYLIAIGTGLVRVVPKALLAAKRLRPDMNLLMTIAVAGAIALGEWFEAGTVSFLFALSLSLEAWSVGKARRAVERLLSLAPPTVRIKNESGSSEVSPDSVATGSLFIVQPGERFALDGVVVDGSSDVDQAPITGESERVPKEPGDEVFAGTINGNGSLEVRSTKLASDTTLAHVIEMVGEARKDRSDSERWVERFARIYTPVVFAVAGLVALVPPLALAEPFEPWIYRALVLLVIGCPCALVIATPVAIVAGLAASARQGVLVKGGQFLEAPASIRVVAVDKTGTLTEGKPRVVSVEPLNDHTTVQLLAIAAAVESRSEHPIARAILQHAEEEGLELPACSDVQIVPGKGTTGTVGGTLYWLGSHRWLEERDQETTEVHDALEERSDAGRSVVVVGTDQHVCGFITLADGLRDDSKAAVAALHAAGIERVAMLTGDNEGTANAIAAEVGIDDVRAELLPADKVTAVESLERDHGRVAMIGDGVNDAPALARASLGIAMGVMGTDVAVETADIALMTDDMSKLAWLIGHSKRTLGIIRQNTIFALAIKAIFVVLTFAGVASLWGAIAADMGASLLVVANALRLLREDVGRKEV